jgi:hypothetical protein
MPSLHKAPQSLALAHLPQTTGCSATWAVAAKATLDIHAVL